jgi:asparagine synthase (glutamine-hydrolysing)
MCGIAGIIGRIDPANRQALGRMERALVHRGPDQCGTWESEPDERGIGCLLAHRRLSILDLSTCADQPMTDPTGGQTIVFNGEIYNYVALRQQLATAGERIESTGDTAVLLRWLATRGVGAVDQLRGMFAFALWDPRKRELTLARDPLGIKPLYLAHIPDSTSGQCSLVFASEVRAILASGLIPSPKLNPSAVASVVWNGFVMGPQTAVRGVESILPGECRTFDLRGQLTHSKMYFTLAGRDARPITEDEIEHDIRESVRLHLASDVPLGVFLSSGVDSSAVVNLAQQLSDHPINTFTLTFEQADLSEGADAKKIAQAIGTNHREISLTESAFVDHLETALDTLDQPTFDGLNSFYMSKAVLEAGLTVALVGTGGDELFGGYTSFRDLPALHALARGSGWIPAAAKTAAAHALAYAARPSISRFAGSRIAPQSRFAKLPEMVKSKTDLLRLYQLAYALFLPRFQRDLLDAEINPERIVDGIPCEMRQRLQDEISGRSALSAIAILEQRCFLGERLLRDTDAASMSVSLEVRLPLVDSVLVRQVNRMPDSLRFFPLRRKALLRRIGLRGLDPELFERPKSGFVLPYDRWIRQKLGKTMDDLMRDPRAATAAGLNPHTVKKLWTAFQSGQKGLYWSRVWAIYVLLRWSRRHQLAI